MQYAVGASSKLEHGWKAIVVLRVGESQPHGRLPGRLPGPRDRRPGQGPCGDGALASLAGLSDSEALGLEYPPAPRRPGPGRRAQRSSRRFATPPREGRRGLGRA